MLWTIISILVSGFVIGSLARWAVPGPDPMPIWLTFAFGFAGAIIGGAIAGGTLGFGKNVSSADYFTIVLAEILAAMALIILYRRFVQKRPITGPDAHRLPTRGIGLTRGKPRPKIDIPGIPGQSTRNERLETLKKLDELHDQGVLSDEEYLEKRSKVLREE